MAMNGIKGGALWRGKTTDDKPMLSGPLTGETRMLIFQNSNKRNDRDPDYFWYIVPDDRRRSRADGERGGSASRGAAGGASKPPRGKDPEGFN
jgi:hypothetical protein